MTLDFYDLKEEPFGFSPDKRFLYVSSAHRQALGSVLRALQAGCGFTTLVAQPGMGKSTLLFHTLNSFNDKVATVYLFQPPNTPVDLLRAILVDLAVVAIDEDEERMFYQLRDVLLVARRLGKRVIIVIDEAQDLDASVFDFLVTLSNRATTLSGRLMQIVFCGQPLLSAQLASVKSIQSIGGCATACLETFSEQDTALYLDYRVRAAGYSRQSPLFTPEAVALVAGYSQGIPRLINHLCFEALSTGYQCGSNHIDADMVQQTAARMSLARQSPKGVVTNMISAPDPTRAQAQPEVVPKKRVPAVKQDAATNQNVAARQILYGAAAPVRDGWIALRSVASRPLSGLTIAAVVILAVTGGVYAMHPGRTEHPVSASYVPRDQTPPTVAIEPKAAFVVPAEIHDVKGMDLQTALRAIGTRKQRLRQLSREAHAHGNQAK